jgi:hypothetical protein
MLRVNSTIKKNWSTKNIRSGFVLFVLMTIGFFFPFAAYSHAITITGSETITTNSSASYSTADCNGTVTWNVAGIGTSISSSGVLTTGPASCGGITVSARCSDGSIATKTARVTNAGQWVIGPHIYHNCPYYAYASVTCISGNTRHFFGIFNVGYPCASCTSHYHPDTGCPLYSACNTLPESGGEVSPGCIITYNPYQFRTTSCAYLRTERIDTWQCLPCTNGQTIPCYSGASETKGVGICKAGTQTCVNGQWGACQGEILPSPEICGNTIDENCDGNKDEGCKTCEISVKVSPSAVWPLIPEKQRPKGYSVDNTRADVVITLTNPAPPDGCMINLKVEPVENSGGHSHNGNRPKGTIDKAVIAMPAGTIGAESAIYKSSEIAGEEKIIAEVKGEKKSEATIIVRVPNLYSMPSGNWRLTGQMTAHPINHYGTYYTVVNTHGMAEDFYEQLDATLGINDMSLKYGGGFDIYGNWLSDITSPQCRQKGHGHCSHRKGTGVDIDRCALSTIQNNPNPRGNCPNGRIRVDRTDIRQLCENYGGRLVEEATIHCEFPYVE